MAELQAALKRIFGFDQFRAGQEAVVRDALAGRDVLALMPTGGGKSLCFQLPALLQPGVTLVVSPLIALMQDQVRLLRDNDIAASFVNSSLDAGEVSRRTAALLRGDYKLFYLAPERLLLTEFLDGPLRRLNERPGVNAFVIDEAHCISSWGHDFRPDYRRLGDAIAACGRPPVGAFTATATPRVRLDIVASLGLRNPVGKVTGFVRENLMMSVVRCRGKAEKRDGLLRRIRPGDGRSLVYCGARKTATELSALLSAAGIAAAIDAYADDAELAARHGTAGRATYAEKIPTWESVCARLLARA